VTGGNPLPSAGGGGQFSGQNLPGRDGRGSQRGPRGGAIPVLLACAACYGVALAWAGVRIAAHVAEPKLPELCQIALHNMA